MPMTISQNMPVYRRSESASPPKQKKSGFVNFLSHVNRSPDKPATGEKTIPDRPTPYEKTISVAPAAGENVIHQDRCAPAAKKTRTATECLIDIIALLQINGVDKYNKPLIESLKHAFLSGQFNHTKIGYMEDFKYKCAPGATEADIKSLHSKIESILASHDTKMNPLLSYVNYYGRLFDSFFASEIIHHPSEKMLNGIQDIRATISCNFKFFHGPNDKIRVCNAMKELLQADPPAWRDDIKEVNDFLHGNTPKNFIRMLYSSHPLAHALIIHLTVKYLAEAPNFNEIKIKAAGIYRQVIKPQRSNLPSLSANPRSHYVGILLSDQHKDNSFTVTGKGIRPMDKIDFTPDSITSLNKKALENGSPVVVGMSGSAHLLNYLLKYLAKGNKELDTEQIKLLSAAELTYSGGHSINEAYASFNLKKNKNFQPLNYNSLCEQPVAKKAIDYAWEEMIKRAVKLNTPEVNL